MLEVMNDSDREDQIEFVLAADLVGASLFDAHLAKGCKRPPRSRQRSIVDIDGKSPRGAVGHGPVRVPSHAATDVEECQSAPVLRLQMCRPTAKLPLVFGAQLGIIVPFIPEPVRRTGRIGW